jgi:hypothetical protein
MRNGKVDDAAQGYTEGHIENLLNDHASCDSFVCAFINKDHASGNIILLVAVKKDRF